MLNRGSEITRLSGKEAAAPDEYSLGARFFARQQENAMNKGDLLSGLSLLVFAIYLIQQTRALEYHYEHGPGPGFFPFWTALGLLIFALILVGVTLIRREQTSRDAPQPGDTRRALGTWVGLVAMIGLVEIVGFFLSFAVFTLLVVVLLDRQSLAKSSAVAFGSALGFYLIFVYAFGLRLPVGPWGF